MGWVEDWVEWGDGEGVGLDDGERVWSLTCVNDLWPVDVWSPFFSMWRIVAVLSAGAGT